MMRALVIEALVWLAVGVWWVQADPLRQIEPTTPLGALCLVPVLFAVLQTATRFVLRRWLRRVLRRAL